MNNTDHETEARPLESRPDAGVSVVVCCYNSADRLPPTIRHLAQQHVGAGIAWEIIIVDNASTDGTAQVALALRDKHEISIPFRVVYQPVQGLSAARAKGLAEAAHEVVLFCDDDNWLADDYVDKAFHAMAANPTVAVVGGVGDPAIEGEPPVWFPRYARWYALGRQGANTGDISETKGYVYGAGLVLRKSAWMELERRGFNSQLTGRKGNSLASSEDRELCYAIRLLGYRIHFDDALRFKHEIPQKRLQWEYFLNMVETANHTAPVMELYEAALAGKPPLPDGAARRHWLLRCLELASQVVRKPRPLIFTRSRVEGSSSAIQWRRTRGTWRGWVNIGPRYHEVQKSVYRLHGERSTL